MDKPVLNKRILSVIDNETSEDSIANQFIKELLFEELEHQSLWRFKNSYRSKIRKYSKMWGIEN